MSMKRPETRTIQEYLDNASWLLKENANQARSYSNMKGFIASEAIKAYTLSKYPPEIRRLHQEAYLHIHDLANGIIPYCNGADLLKLLGIGLWTTHTVSGPPKHFTSALDQIVNFLCTSQQEWAGAQAFGDFNTLLAPLVAADRLTEREVEQALQQFIFNLNYPSRSALECYIDGTKVLTDSGWKDFKAILKTDLVLTVNLESEILEWQRPLRIVSYQYSGPVYRLKNMRTEQCITPGHRIVRFKYWSKTSELIPIEEVLKLKSPILLPLAFPYPSEDYPITDEEIKFWAWILSEGSVRATITQSVKKEREATEIEEVLKALNLKFSKKIISSEGTRFGGAPVYRFLFTLTDTVLKGLPFDYMKLSRRQAKLLLSEFRKGDGDRNRFRLYTKSKRILEMITALAVIAGYAVHVLKRRPTGTYPISIITDFKDRTWNSKIEEEYYTGKVWCLTTKNNTLVTRLNGKIAFSGNTPFTNVMFNTKCPKPLEEMSVVTPRMEYEVYGDFHEESMLILRAFNEVLMQGDYAGNPFTFPLPTINLIETTDFEDELWLELMRAEARLGPYYFMNFIGSGISPNSIRAMCCRLILDLNELPPAGGRWAYQGSTGSLGVVTLNMAKLGFNAKSSDELFERLDYLLGQAEASLLLKDAWCRDMLDSGLLPLTRYYGINFDRYFRTIGIIGLHEMTLNFLGEPIWNSIGFVRKILEHIRDWTRRTQLETGRLWNFEMTPGEGAATRMAIIDRKLHPSILTQGTDSAPYYTTLLTPPSVPLNFFDRLHFEEKLLPLFTGGTVHRIYVGESLPSPEGLLKLVERIASKTRIPYYDLAATFSICRACGSYRRGAHRNCLKCGADNKIFSRIVGYYRDISQANIGKVAEFWDRTYVTL